MTVMALARENTGQAWLIFGTMYRNGLAGSPKKSPANFNVGRALIYSTRYLLCEENPKLD